MRTIDSRIIFNGSSEAGTNCIAFCEIVSLTDGMLLATARIGSGMDTADGNVGIWCSTDLGQTWSGPQIPFNTDFGGKKGCLREGFITQLSDRKLIMTCCWVDRSVKGRKIYNRKTAGLCEMFPLISESHDAGDTWSALKKVDLFPISLPSALTGRSIILADGGLACQFESQKVWTDISPIFNISGFKVSYDNGITWPEYVQVAGRPYEDIVNWDQRIACFPSGRMISLFWSYNTVQNIDRNIHVNFSNEFGRNWSKPIDTGVKGQIACPVVVNESLVVMLYVRRDEKRQILARKSIDGGKTWDIEPEICIYEDVDNRSCSSNLFDEMSQWSYGHPFGINSKEDIIDVVYYAGKGQNTALYFCKIKLE